MDYTLITSLVQEAQFRANLSKLTHYVAGHRFDLQVTSSKPKDKSAIVEVCRPIKRG